MQMNCSPLPTVFVIALLLPAFSCLPLPQILSTGLETARLLSSTSRVYSAPVAALPRPSAASSLLKSSRSATSAALLYKTAPKTRLVRTAAGLTGLEAGMPSHFAEQPMLRHQIGEYKIKDVYKGSEHAENYFIATSRSLIEADGALAKAEIKLEKLEYELADMKKAKAAASDIKKKQIQINQAKIASKEAEQDFDYAKKDYENVGTFVEAQVLETHRRNLERVFVGKPPALNTIDEDSEWELYDHPDMPSA